MTKGDLQNNPKMSQKDKHRQVNKRPSHSSMSIWIILKGYATKVLHGLTSGGSND